MCVESQNSAEFVLNRDPRGPIPKALNTCASRAKSLGALPESRFWKKAVSRAKMCEHCVTLLRCVPDYVAHMAYNVIALLTQMYNFQLFTIVIVLSRGIRLGKRTVVTCTASLT